MHLFVGLDNESQTRKLCYTFVSVFCENEHTIGWLASPHNVGKVDWSEVLILDTSYRLGEDGLEETARCNCFSIKVVTNNDDVESAWRKVLRPQRPMSSTT
jgi:hypothetical protein